MTEDQLSALLRTVKRHEQPPPEYFDQLLRDLHRRQRAELLRRPLWRIGVERLQTFFGEHSMGPASYAGAMAAVVVLGVTVIGVAVPSKFEQVHPSGAIAQNAAATPTPFTLQPSQVSVASQTPLFPHTPRQAPSSQTPPRYVIDARPVLYENPSFSF